MFLDFYTGQFRVVVGKPDSRSNANCLHLNVIRLPDVLFDPNFERLYRQYHPNLVAFATYIVRSKEDAVEIVNDVFVAVWNKRNELQFNDELRSYLFTATRNRSLNFLKKKKIAFADLLEQDGKSDLNADTNLRIKEQQMSIQQVVDSLPLRCKQVFMMSRIDGFSYKEIAELMGISVKTVENQISKALKIFKENFKRE